KDSVNVDPSLTDSLEQLYGGSVYKLDQRSINEWVNAATNGNIPSLEISGIESGNIEAALMAAQFFKAEWMYKFPEAETSPGAFDDERQDNPYACMMRLSSDDEIIRIADFTVDEVDYKVTRLSFRDNGEGRGYSFHIYSSDGTSILPHSDNLLQYLLAQGLVRFDDMRKSNGVVRFPRFKISPNQTHQISPSSLALRDASGNMFSTFPLAWVGNDLSVANITHKAAVQIDESGGEAASVTSLAGTRGGSSMPFFNHDKPFLAMILDPSGTILFMMMVTDPVDPFVEDAVTADTDCQVGSFTPAAP
ncbi:MAG: serpin family protein, partial [Polyangiales bacterium]